MDVVDLREFYRHELGQTAARLITRQLRTLTLPRSGQTVLGLGYALPYLDALMPDDALGLAFMMARQGVIHWPTEEAVRSSLVDEDDLPLLESVIDVALVVHGLEFADAPREMLQEVWRVMAPQGRLLLVVPNRHGLWSAAESSPFGHGLPWSRMQISALLKECRFSVTQWRGALFTPPLARRMVLASATGIEALGERMLPRFAGVTIVEAMKQVYAFSAGKRARRIMPRLRPVLLPAPRPVSRKTTDN